MPGNESLATNISCETERAGRLKYLAMTHEYPPVGGGGAYVAERICRALAKKDVSPEVLTGAFSDLQQDRIANGVEIRTVPAARKSLNQGSLMNMGLFFVSAFAALITRLARRQRRPEVIHAHFLYPAGLVAFVMKKMYGVPYVVTLHGGDIPGNDPDMDLFFKILEPLTRTILTNARAVVSVSGQSVHLVKRAGAPDVLHIPNGTTVGTHARPPATDRPLEIMFAGRLVELKRVDLLIRAVSTLPEDIDWRLTICGHGPMAEALKQLASGLGIDDRVCFTGWVDQERIQALYEQADVFVLPSSSEGMSMSALEAMGKGAALVLSDIPGNRELVVEGVNGHLFQKNHRDLARAIVRCSGSLAELSAGALETAKKYDWDIIAASYLDLFPQKTERP